MILQSLQRREDLSGLIAWPWFAGLLIAWVNKDFTSSVITLSGRTASIEASRLNGVGLWFPPGKLTMRIYKAIFKSP